MYIKLRDYCTTTIVIYMLWALMVNKVNGIIY